MEIKYVSDKEEKIKLFYRRTKKKNKYEHEILHECILKVYNSNKKIVEISFSDIHSFLIPNTNFIRGLFNKIAKQKLDSKKLKSGLERSF